jgi:hypothetical protein
MDEAATASDFRTDTKVYPDRNEFIAALQEEEVVDPKSPEGALHYPKLNKMGGKVFKLLERWRVPQSLLQPEQGQSRDSQLLCSNFASNSAKQKWLRSSEDLQMPMVRFTSSETTPSISVLMYSFTLNECHLKSKIIHKQEDRTPSRPGWGQGCHTN